MAAVEAGRPERRLRQQSRQMREWRWDGGQILVEFLFDRQEQSNTAVSYNST